MRWGLPYDFQFAQKERGARESREFVQGLRSTCPTGGARIQLQQFTPHPKYLVTGLICVYAHGGLDVIVTWVSFELLVQFRFSLTLLPLKKKKADMEKHPSSFAGLFSTPST